jgi:flagellar protein FliL
MSTDKTKKEEKPKGGKAKKIILITVAALLVAGGGTGAGFYAAGTLGSHEKAEDPRRPKLVERSEEHAEEASTEHGNEAPPKVGTVAVKSDKVKADPRKYEVTYYPIDQNLTSNLSDGQGFVQIGLSLSTYYDGKIIGNIKRQMVPIRSIILLTLSQQDGTVLATPEGKEMLQKQLTASINRVLREKEGFGGVDNVYFTTLVIQ